ncbi:hypothetical protein [Aliiglaciecola sp. LCG003]|uniref:hypothetical protein n=1 Tax=Aliiglaciecola sp. LCG003 TaxID=3053655 RepID=UPI0025741E4E|nr:hypothetical protein [Aliiglaciecola sp. LCG003]WJG08752.1 hypothetical protein QR722_15615 [Aliiglaciecola sp. LCG003]
MNNLVVMISLGFACSFSALAEDTGKNREEQQPIRPLTTSAAQQPIRTDVQGPTAPLPTRAMTDSMKTADGKLHLQDTIRSSREQPKVLTIVPWQPPRDKASLPSPFVKRIEQDFMPVERQEFTRLVEHFERVSGAPQPQK